MRRTILIGLAAFGLFAALLAIETFRATEPFDAVTFAGDVLEMAVLASAVVLTASASVETRRLRQERHGLLADLASARHDSEAWRAAARTHVTGLSRAIDGQFRAWGLTEAEADIAALILKGLSHKEIATLREGSEATVRQHATAVYRKAGLTGRAQLTAYFLEDLLAPTAPAGPRGQGLAVVAGTDPGRA